MATRKRLVHDIQARITAPAAEFLLSIHDGVPKLDLIGLPAGADLPAIRWKLINLEKLRDKNPEKLRCNVLRSRLRGPRAEANCGSVSGDAAGDGEVTALLAGAQRAIELGPAIRHS